MNSSMTIVYEVTFEKYPESKAAYTWSIVRKGREWKVTGYKIETDIGTFSEINKKLEKMPISNLNIGTADKIDLEKAKELANQVVEQYKIGEYRDIYSKGNSAIKKNGNEDQFVKYLSSAATKYGKLNSYKLNSQEISTDKLEVSFNYSLNYEKDAANLGLRVWIRMEDNLYLSGIKFVENSW